MKAVFNCHNETEPPYETTLKDYIEHTGCDGSDVDAVNKRFLSFL